MSDAAWWTRRPEPATVTQEPELPTVIETPGPAPDPHEGATLVLAPEPAAPPPAEPAAPRPADPAATSARDRAADRAGPPRRRRVLVALATGAALALLAGSATALLAGDGDDARQPAAATATIAVPVDPAAVTATATSTQEPAGDITYDAANTLDGDPATAWNSNGWKAGAGTGGAAPVSLTYTFAAPVDLRDVVLRNGYQKVRHRRGRAPVDLYPANARVHRLRVVTDAGAWTWDLADVRAPQTFTGAAGRTGSVRLEVVSVWASPTYPDVALSEVSFTALPTAS